MSAHSPNITLLVEGMDCASCAMGITKNLQKKGLENVNVNYVTGEATFVLEDKTKLQSIIDGINSIGYKVVDSKYREEREGKLSQVEKRFCFSLPFTIILFFSHMIFAHDFILNNAYVQLLICLPVFILGVMQFGFSGYKSLKSGVPNMDVLIFIGSTSAFVYSVAAMWMYKDTMELHKYLFFETTATIITLVLLGNVFEHRSVKQTTTALRDLSAIQPNKAKLVGLQLGKETITEVDYKDVIVGAILQVNTGDKIPVDGEIISGDASVDEAMITGESIPADKMTGDKVIGGTIVLSGSVRLRAESVGNETVLAKIIELVKKAQQNKPDIQKLGDKISAIFVPVVLGLSVVTFIVNYFFIDFHSLNVLKESIMRSIAVLVISCPCAMGLATPTAVMVGIGRAAKMGILIKGGSTLEEFAKVKNIVFDKTGTLTTGNFKIKNITTFNNVSKNEVKDILFQIEQHSSHPIAKSIVTELKGTLVNKTFINIKEEKGMGMSAKDRDNNEYSIGSYKVAAHLTLNDMRAVYVIKNNQLIATIDLQDEVKTNAKQLITDMKQAGLQTIMMSGDNKTKCETLANELGINKTYSELLPSEKLEEIEKLVNSQPTAMVGDGVNDAPALAKATVGVSLSNATQVAIQSAQIVLLKSNDLAVLSQAYLISKHSLITIKQNLFWAFFYNVVAIPLAAAGFLSPMIAALAMAFSDVIVIGNSIRLKTKILR